MSTLPGDAPQRLIAAVKGRYIIQRLIGSGASSKVFLAEDEKHGRPVAIKVMHSDLAASVGAQRFSREIRVAARLSHPHILTVFDSGDADGLLWYVMPFVDGESVRDRLNREKQLPVNDVISITHDVADALAYAHEQGVIHRDVKPENILLTRAHALVADFGIAKASDTRLTTDAGMALGTPAYMSPEQATGEAIIDGRSDVYALGCLMYEMLTGKPAFTGKTVPIILSQVMTLTPKSVSTVRDDIPPQLQAAVEIAMAKDPAERFQTATQLADALRWAMTPSSTPAVATPAHGLQPVAAPRPAAMPAPTPAPIPAPIPAPMPAPAPPPVRAASPVQPPLQHPAPAATPPAAPPAAPVPAPSRAAAPAPPRAPAQAASSASPFVQSSSRANANAAVPAAGTRKGASNQKLSPLAIVLIGLVGLLVVLLLVLLFRS